jgi:hypothetical protein
MGILCTKGTNVDRRLDEDSPAHPSLDLSLRLSELSEFAVKPESSSFVHQAICRRLKHLFDEISLGRPFA